SIANDQDEQIAHIAMKFHDRKEDDVARCAAAGNERTGAIAVVRSSGAAGPDPLIPMTNTQQQYCFSYSSQSTYELLAAKRNPDGSCPAPPAFRGVSNDYVMLLISADTVAKPGKGGSFASAAGKTRSESADRCRRFKLDAPACGS